MQKEKAENDEIAKLFKNNKEFSFSERSIFNFENGNNNRFRIGTGYTFKLKYSFIRAELNYDYDFNSLNKNTLPFGNLTKVTNNALSINFVVESRSRIIRKKGKKVKIGRIK